MVPRAGGVRVSAATRRLGLWAAGSAGTRSSGQALAQGCPARRAPGGGSGQRLLLSSGCRGGVRVSGGRGASRLRVRCSEHLLLYRPAGATARDVTGRQWVEEAGGYYPRTGQTDSSQEEVGMEPCQCRDKFSHSCSKLELGGAAVSPESQCHRV